MKIPPSTAQSGVAGHIANILAEVKTMSREEQLALMDALNEQAELAAYWAFCKAESKLEKSRHREDPPSKYTSKATKFVRAIAALAYADSTNEAYDRIGERFTRWLIAKGFIDEGESPFTQQCLHPDSDALIVGFVMDLCDDTLFDGSRRADSDPPSSMSYAWKIRSAITKLYAFEGERGRVAWDKETQTGNPSLSYLVQYYFKSLHRRKVQEHGETAIPSRAITSEHMQKLYRVSAEKIVRPCDDDWAGTTLRLMMHAMYTISFVCFLRIDETLRLQAHNIEFSQHPDTKVPVMTVTLEWRKSDQTGQKIKPFVIPALPANKSHLCPVRWMTRWLTYSKISSGLIFQKLTSDHELIALKQKPLSAQYFVLYFRNMLADIEVYDVYAYGAHSFRRGGVQYCNGYLHWPVRDIVQWGGWSTNFNSKTVHLYLISWNDDEVKNRSNFWLLGSTDAPPRCSLCGR